MPSHSHRILTSSEEPNWRTPEWLARALDQEFHLALDCAAAPTVAVRDLPFMGPGSTLIEDALIEGLDWWDVAYAALEDRGYPVPNVSRMALYCNPPYARKLGMAIEPWIERLAQHGERGTTIGVVPFAPQTKWWRTYVEGQNYQATEVRRFPFRIAFDPPVGLDADDVRSTANVNTANVNTVVVIWKPTQGFQGSPWAPLSRYWAPDSYYAHKAAQRQARKEARQRGNAVPEADVDDSVDGEAD